MPLQTAPDGRYIVPWPPGIWTAPMSGKRYAGSGGVRIEIDDDWTLDDIQEFFVWGAEARKYWDSNYSEEPVKTIEVKGSRGNTYKVTKQSDKWKCQCSGFQFRGKCKHITNLKILLEG